jgi:ferredoxin
MPTSKRVLIVGSGPSGVAAAMKLQSLGIETVMIDSDLKESDDFFRDKLGVGKRKKLLFGSDYPYRHFNFGPRIITSGSDLPYSFTQGGLSTIWGASFLPYSENDVLDWPINLNGLKLGYEFIAKRVPISSCSQRKLLSYADYQNQVQLEPDVVFRTLDNFDFESELLEIGGSRLAVRAGRGSATDCVYCGKCLLGCSFGSIWSSKDELKSLINNGLTYISGERVLSLHTDEQDLTVNTVSKDGTSKKMDGFTRVFLATGNVETFRILAESGIIENHAEVQHSTTFYFPSLVFKKGLKNSNNLALSQAFIRLQNEFKKSVAHFQLYSLSQEMMDNIAFKIPLMRFLPLKLRSFLMAKVIVAIGYCDSQQYSKLQFVRVANGNCQIHGEFILSRRQIRRKLRKKIWQSRLAFRKLGLIALPRFMILGQPGDGVHAGGWLVTGDKCDQTGTPFGVKRVHVIDSSVLSSIPDGPITFAIMANAVRIVSEVYS